MDLKRTGLWKSDLRGLQPRLGPRPRLLPAVPRVVSERNQLGSLGDDVPNNPIAFRGRRLEEVVEQGGIAAAQHHSSIAHLAASGHETFVLEPPTPSPPTPAPCTTISTATDSGALSSTDMQSTSSSTGASATTHVPPSAMFDRQHVERWTLPMLLWAPFGTLLAVFRAVCWVFGVIWDAPWFRNPSVVATYCRLLGFKASWENLHLLPKGHHVMVSNHTTSADLMSLFQLPSRYVHLITTAMPARVTATRHLPVVLRPASPEVYDNLAKQHAAAAAAPGGIDAAQPPLPPVHVFPEGGLTNGKAMMPFSRGFMKFVAPGTPVVPVALRAHTPWGVRPHTLTSSFLANLFWLSWVPWVQIRAVVLPPMTQAPGEGRGAFVQRVQAEIAKELGVPVADLGIQQKRALMKRVEKGGKW